MSDLEGRQLFIVTFVVDEPLNNGQEPRVINIPAFVADWEAAAERAHKYIASFSTTPEARQTKDVKLKLRSIMVGGTILI
jgi:hypothetical protein